MRFRTPDTTAKTFPKGTVCNTLHNAAVTKYSQTLDITIFIYDYKLNVK